MWDNLKGKNKGICQMGKIRSRWLQAHGQYPRACSLVAMHLEGGLDGGSEAQYLCFRMKGKPWSHDLLMCMSWIILQAQLPAPRTLPAHVLVFMPILPQQLDPLRTPEHDLSLGGFLGESAWRERKGRGRNLYRKPSQVLWHPQSLLGISAPTLKSWRWWQVHFSISHFRTRCLMTKGHKIKKPRMKENYDTQRNRETLEKIG